MTGVNRENSYGFIDNRLERPVGRIAPFNGLATTQLIS